MTDENDHRTESLVTKVLYLPDRYVDALFALLLLSFTAGTIYYGLEYEFETAILPLLTATVTVALILYLFVTKRVKYLPFLEQDRETIDEGESAAEYSPSRRKSVYGFLWVVVLSGLVFAIGIEMGVFAFLLAYYRLQSGLSWVYTVGLSVVIWLGIIVLFGFIVEVPLYEGYLIEQLL